MTSEPLYSHTQKGHFCWVLYGLALVLFTLAWVFDPANSAVGVGHLVAALIVALVALGFHHLAIVDRGDFLEIRYGPLPFFHRKVWYADVDNTEVGRTLLLDGWGVHYSIRGGWVWNLWGRDCVVVHWKKGSVLRIGTDDADGLARFLHEKVGRTG